jgi:hypothetical protein
VIDKLRGSQVETIIKEAEKSLRIQKDSLILLLNACANELLGAKEEDETKVREGILKEVNLFRHERAIFQDYISKLIPSAEPENVRKEISDRVADLKKQSAALNGLVRQTLNRHFPPEIPQKPVKRELALQNPDEKVITIYSAPDGDSTEEVPD